MIKFFKRIILIFKNNNDSIDYRIKYIFNLIKNALIFKLLNFNKKKDQLCLFPGFTLNVHNRSYNAFRYFTDLEPELANEMKLFRSLIKTKKIFIDIGAHYGIFSMVFSYRQGSTSYAIEPSPQAFNILQHNINLNNNLNIQPFKIAMGNSNKNINMVLADNDHYIYTDNVNSGEKVEMDTLDNFVSSKNIIPDVIKIDVEGFEYEVLTGAKKTLKKNKPMIFLEVHPELIFNHNTVNKIYDLLIKNNYKIYNLDKKIVDKIIFNKKTKVFRIVAINNH